MNAKRAGAVRSSPLCYTKAYPIRNAYVATRYKDWLRQAEHDLEQAEDSRKAGRHEWACFASHQAAEMAIKALHDFWGQQSWGHTLMRLLTDLPQDLGVSGDLVDKVRVLDTFYIPTRYTDAHPEGAPFERYGALQSKEAVQYAREVIAFVRDALAKQKDRP
ncbi:MAG: HEPN domain-containing protein [Chloroflexi bacterium]|nr:HEPN domain-containing protein [Chloroflexota bacterium]